jgi:hypothetical protein
MWQLSYGIKQAKYFNQAKCLLKNIFYLASPSLPRGITAPIPEGACPTVWEPLFYADDEQCLHPK